MSSEETTNLKQITVEVPEERVAEFHMFFGRFLAGRGRHGRRGRHGHCGHHRHERQQTPTTDVAEV